jgi:hypothetical protein
VNRSLCYIVPVAQRKEHPTPNRKVVGSTPTWDLFYDNSLIFFFFEQSFFFLIISGHTDDYSAMVNGLVKKYPSTHIISVGFSLGGNLITKYLGEKNVPKPANIIGGISICQGYDATV